MWPKVIALSGFHCTILINSVIVKQFDFQIWWTSWLNTTTRTTTECWIFLNSLPHIRTRKKDSTYESMLWIRFSNVKSGKRFLEGQFCSLSMEKKAKGECVKAKGLCGMPEGVYGIHSFMNWKPLNVITIRAINYLLRAMVSNSCVCRGKHYKEALSCGLHKKQEKIFGHILLWIKEI